MEETDARTYRCRYCALQVSRHTRSCFPVAKSYTLWLNLEQRPKCLLRRMRRTTCCEIRRAQKECLRYEFTSAPNTAWVKQFFHFYDLLAKSKNLKSSVDRNRLLALLNGGVLDLSRISSSDGRILVWHASIRSRRCACCLYSASLFRCETKTMAAYIGRANRLLHWYDMLRSVGRDLLSAISVDGIQARRTKLYCESIALKRVSDETWSSDITAIEPSPGKVFSRCGCAAHIFRTQSELPAAGHVRPLSFAEIFTVANVLPFGCGSGLKPRRLMRHRDRCRSWDNSHTCDFA